MRMNLLVAFATIAMVAAPAAAQVTSNDANPTQAPFTYGSGNNYTPANAVVETDPTTDRAGNYEIAGRAHVPTVAANSTGGTGVYTFNLGQNVSIDYSFFGAAAPNSTVRVTNLDGGTASFDAALFGSLNSSGAIQGSQQLGFGFLNGGFGGIFGDINFDNMVNSTFQIDLLGGNSTLR